MTAIREQCGCGSAIRIDHSDDPAPIAREWRGSHPCDRRGPEREVFAGASELLGFHRDEDDTQPLPMPPATRRDLREVRP